MSESLSSLVTEALADVERLMLQSLASEVPLLQEAARLAILAGGKRLRPTVLLLAQKAVADGPAPIAAMLAAAVEMLHTASLVHDDINDQSDLRRGQPTVRSRWSNTAALLVGDFVFVRLLDLVADAEPEVIHVLAGACRALIEGETMQMRSAWDPSLTVERYMETIGKKTAALLAASAELGALAAGASMAQRHALHVYGYQLGLAFQIRDDILDLTGDSELMGKPTTNDLDRGLVSLPTLYALQERPQLAAALAGRDPAPIQAAIRELDTIPKASAAARTHAAKAEAALEALPPSAAHDELARLARWAGQRDR